MEAGGGWGKEGEKKLYLFCVSWGRWSIDVANVKPLAQDQECYVYELIMNPCPMTHPFIFGQSCVCTYLIYFLHTTPARTRVTVIRESDRHGPATRCLPFLAPNTRTGSQRQHRSDVGIASPSPWVRVFRDESSDFSWCYVNMMWAHRLEITACDKLWNCTLWGN